MDRRRVSAGEPAADAAPLAELEERLGYAFRDRSLLELALTHASLAHERTEESNERLEFLGDAVVGFVVAHFLYSTHPRWSEGDLTRALSRLVDRRGLAAAARRLELGRHLRLGRTERRSDGDTKASILANAVEAVFAAVLLDGGIEPVRELARSLFPSALDPAAPRVEADPKTRFQEQVMTRYAEFPTYELVADTELEGDEARFTVRALVRGEEWARGSGRSKRAAERAAALVALEQRRSELDG